MKKSKMLMAALLSCACFMSGASQLILSNNTPQNDTYTAVELTGELHIDVMTGDVIVSPVLDKFLIDAASGPLVELYPSAYLASLNDDVTITLVTYFVENCQAQEEWTQTNLNSSDGSSSYSLTFNGQTTTLGVKCDSVFDGSEVFATPFDIKLLTGNSNNPVAPQVIIRGNGNSNNSSHLLGNTVNLSFVISENDQACSFSSSSNVNGWSFNAWDQRSDVTADGSINIPFTPTVAGTYTFNLSCTDSDNLTGSDTLSLTFSEANNGFCNDFPPPPGTSEQLNSDGSKITYFQATNGNDFGFSVGSQANFPIDRNKYVALQLQAPNIDRAMVEVFETGSPVYTQAPYAVAISRCPGDFSNQSMGTQQQCYKEGTGLNLHWSTRSSSNQANTCKLVKGETYYLNIIHAWGPAYNNSLCSSNECGVLFKETSSPF